MDDGVDAVLFVEAEEEGIGEGEEYEGGKVEEDIDEIDPCLAGNVEEEEDGEEEGENEGQELQKEPSVGPSTTKGKPSKRNRKQDACVPDKSQQARSVPKGKPWYLKKKRDPFEKRHDSKIIFVMPRQEDPEVIALRKTNKLVQKLIKYMKQSWEIRVDRAQEERELEHRTLASVYTRKPDNWQELIRNREEISLQTGFFSPLDVPYDALVDLELDTALLAFNNLPPDLKITADKWIKDKLEQEELKRKREAFLPRLPHGKVKRPSYNKGRLTKDPGGVAKVDQFVKVAENFYKVTKGSTPFSKVLKEWSSKKEKESYSMNSGFGVVREGMFDFRRNKGRGSKDFSGGVAGKEKNNDLEQRRVSIVDARKYQRDMLHYEKFMMAIYDIMKSLLNIKMKQLESKFPLPPTAVLQIRADPIDTPEHSTIHKPPPLLVLQRNALKERKSHAHIIGLDFDHTSFSNVERKSLFHGESGHGHANDEIEAREHPVDKNVPPLLSIGKRLSINPSANHIDPRKSISDFGHKDLMRRMSTVKDVIEHRHGRIEDIAMDEIINISPVRSTTQIIEDIKRELSYQDMMDLKGRKHQMLTAEQKIKRLAENPEHAAMRRARNYTTYAKLFENNKKMKRPVWHNIDIAEMAMDFKSAKSLADKDPANLTEADAAEVVEAALKKRNSMSRKPTLEGVGEEEANKRWPEEYDIPTPTFPFPHSKVKIPSEEQSRLNLLKKTPHIDETPSTPVRRLYELAGVRTTEMDLFTNIMEMKKMFRVTENKLRVYYENEIGKLDWDTLKRFRCKLNGLHPRPVYQSTISLMRMNQQQSPEPKPPGAPSTVAEDEDAEEKKLMQKRPALWYKKLKEEAEMNGATRHNGCHTELQKLLRYCDVDMKTKPHMLNRLALLVVSLPTTELGTRHWQQAIVFLLEHMFGTPPQVIHAWLKYRGLPYLL